MADIKAQRDFCRVSVDEEALDLILVLDRRLSMRMEDGCDSPTLGEVANALDSLDHPLPLISVQDWRPNGLAREQIRVERIDQYEMLGVELVKELAHPGN